MRLSTAFCVAFTLAGAAPLAAQDQGTPAGTGSHTAISHSVTTGDHGATGNTNPAAGSSAEAPVQKKLKKKTASTQAPKTTASGPNKPAAKSGGQARSGAAIVKEGGKTCSGQDQYRVCW
ncbi:MULTISPECIES: hypothetical protein [Rhodomicrobium]|uniref:hypothetical protein n=1 Tax=Rhodomicrobium TaxID=1068 RepID=UPI000F73F55F|nr:MULTISPECIES: hypothetical protein [Rhodomicrobium]